MDTKKVKLGIAPIGWCNDDMPELGGEKSEYNKEKRCFVHLLYMD